MNTCTPEHRAWLCAVAVIVGFGAAAPMALGDSEVAAETVTASNMVRQVSQNGTNYFISPVGIGTNNPAAQLHVLGDSQLQGGLSVSGAMTLPAQGDVSMGTYTAGVSQAGLQGALPLGSEGNLLFHSGSAWTALTNVFFDAASGRLYMGSTTNAGTYLETGTGRLVVGGDVVLGSNTISRSGGSSGIGIDADGNITLSGGDIALGGFTVDESTGDMSAGSNRISNLADPSAAQDAATRHYVDNALTNVPPYGCTFYAYQGTGQSLSPSTWTTLRMDGTRYDEGGDFTTWTGSDSYFTAPADGHYLFGASACVSLSDGRQLRLTFQKESSTYAYAAQMAAGAAFWPIASGSCLASMSAGEKMRLQIFQTDTISQSTYAVATYTYFWGYRVK